MKQQLNLLFTAVQFYTRIPVPGRVIYKQENLGSATRYLPLIGWVVGIIAGFVWLAGAFLTNISIGLLLSVTASVFTTGAFHEDGFADVCDGFGGGWTKEKILEIMKDSRIGTYGAVGLILMLGLKFIVLQNLAYQQENRFLIITAILVSGHAVSRLMPVFVILTQPYARKDSDNKAGAVSHAASRATILIAICWAVIPMLFLAILTRTAFVFSGMVLPALVTFFLARFFRKWIGGYTGDCLGAIQQVSEVSFYLTLTIVWKFI